MEATSEETIAMWIKPDKAAQKENLTWLYGIQGGNQSLSQKQEFMAKVVEGLGQAKQASDVYLTELIEKRKKTKEQAGANTQA